MKMLKNYRKFWLVVLVFAVLGVFSSFSLGSREAGVPCTENAFIKIDRYTLKVPLESLFGAFRGKKLSKTHCRSSIEHPIEADELSFSQMIKLPDYEKPYMVQYFVVRNKANPLIKKIEAELEKENKTIADLPIEKSFIKYEDKLGSVYYFKNGPFIDGGNDQHLILSGCTKREGFLSCSTGFVWKPNIYFKTREMNLTKNLPKSNSVDIWLKAFPVYLRTLESMIVDVEGEKQ